MINASRQDAADGHARFAAVGIALGVLALASAMGGCGGTSRVAADPTTVSAAPGLAPDDASPAPVEAPPSSVQAPTARPSASSRASAETRPRTLTPAPADGPTSSLPAPIEAPTDAPVTEGGLSRAVIRGVIQEHVDEVRGCYEVALSTEPELTGRVIVSFIIISPGVVRSAAVAESTLPLSPLTSAVHDCIVEAVRTWRFPEPEGGRVVGVNYPFVLATE